MIDIPEQMQKAAKSIEALPAERDNKKIHRVLRELRGLQRAICSSADPETSGDGIAFDKVSEAIAGIPVTFVPVIDADPEAGILETVDLVTLTDDTILGQLAELRVLMLDSLPKIQAKAA
ncbi:MAG: hypothetical protein O2904_03710 [bacterium]|nr:hypothetical protein [bacterium]